MKTAAVGRIAMAPVRTRRVTRARGMALVIALIVLVVVSILGAVAMRTAMFQNRISINSQTDNLAFQAAESGLSASLKKSRDDTLAGFSIKHPDNTFNKAVNKKAQRICFTKDAITVDEQTTVDADGVAGYTVACAAVAGSNATVTTVVAEAPEGGGGAAEGFDFKYGAKLLLIEARAHSEVPNTNVQTVHVQQWGVVSPAESEGN